MPDLSSATLWKSSPPSLSHILSHINKHTHHVPSPHTPPPPPTLPPQSTSAEVTRQVAANKTLRGQLQEKEDKLRQLQDKSVPSSFFFLVERWKKRRNLFFHLLPAIHRFSLFLGRCTAHLLHPLFILSSPSSPRLIYPHGSHPQCLIPPCGSSLPAAARCSGKLPLREKTSTWICMLSLASRIKKTP